LAATMSQKSSVPQATKFVSQALKQDNLLTLSSSHFDRSGPQQQSVSFHARRRRFAALPCTITFSFLAALSIDDHDFA